MFDTPEEEKQRRKGRGATPPTPGRYPQGPVSEKKKILVADDSETIRALLQTALESAGYEVDMAKDGVSAYELGTKGDYDLVVMDQLMPGLLGLDVVSRWHEEGTNVPVLMLTGVDDDRTAVESFDRGVVDYVRKPFRITELMARIRMRL
jgi:two-component system alkaline phosphatase synthesis response regulator PhoP